MKRREKRAVDYVFGALFQLAVLVAINSWPLWLPFTFGVVTPAYEQVVWAANLAALVKLLQCVWLAFTRPQWLLHFTKMMVGVANAISTLAFVAVFPFNFAVFAGPWMNPLVRGAMLLAILVALVQVLVSAARFIFNGPSPKLTTRA
ncbi:MAG: hypothetical protein QM723_27355 [Myxococcaceae bacterium]